MPEEVLDGADIGARFKQVGCEGVAQCMAGDALVEIGFANRLAELAGHGVIVEVIAGVFAGLWLGAEPSGGEQPLPRPLARCVGKLAQE